MQLNFEISQDIIQGSSPAIIHGADNSVIVVYTAPDGAMRGLKTETEYGEWNERTFTPIEMISGEIGAENLRSKTITGYKSAFVWYVGGLHRMALEPDNTPVYMIDDPYRLYYAVDTEKLYLNIAQNWSFISTLRHSLMKELDQDNHPQYLNQDRHMQIHSNSPIDFTDLKNTPMSYKGHAGQVITVDSTESGLQFSPRGTPLQIVNQIPDTANNGDVYLCVGGQYKYLALRYEDKWFTTPFIEGGEGTIQ